MKYFLVFLYLWSLSCLDAQSMQDYIWLLGIDQSAEPGNQAYRFDFNIRPFEVLRSDNGLGFDSNNASICDSQGNLLFYTNGCAVLNKHAQVMPNGDSLNYGVFMELLWDPSCEYGYPGTNNCMILTDPSNEDLYYIIHKEFFYNGSDQKDSIRLLYSVVDMTLDEGNGDVIEKNKIFFSEEHVLSSYLTSIQHANGRDWWVLQPMEEDSFFVTFLIDELGIHKSTYQSAYQYFDWFRSSASGTARFSPDGTKYALYNYYDQLHIYDFDRVSGLLSNHRTVVLFEDIDRGEIRFSSVEWSPNSRFIYTASRHELHQIDMWEPDLQDGIRLIDTYNGTVDPFPTNFFLMAQGPDCRIYMCSTSGSRSYHVINKPDELGQACDFVQNGVQLPFPSGVASFPNFPRFRVDEEEKCDPTITSMLGEQVYYRRNMEVYPNPTYGPIHAKIPSAKPGTLAVTDMEGRMVWVRRITGEALKEIDLSHLAAGTYEIGFYPEDMRERIFYSTRLLKL